MKDMTNTETNWERIQRTSWPSVYLGELYWLAKEALELCEQVFGTAPPPPVPGESYIRVDHKLHQDIYRILNSAARIATLVRHRDRNKRNQSAGQYAVQQQRIDWLGQLLEGIELTEVLNSNVRHSLEHFDEFIDETALKSSRGVFQEPTLFPLDMAFGTAGTMEGFQMDNIPGGSVYPLRVYIAKDMTFLNCGRRIDLGRVAEECRQIYERVSAVSPHVLEQGDGGRGSSMPIVTEASYQHNP